MHILHDRGFPSDRYIFGIGVATDDVKGEPYVILDQPTFGLDRDVLALGERSRPTTFRLQIRFISGPLTLPDLKNFGLGTVLKGRPSAKMLIFQTPPQYFPFVHI